MVDASEIGWGSYDKYEGPYWTGKCKFALPESPTNEERILAVLTATEGGRFDAYNGYDRCICTSGLIQWCEAGQYSVSNMLGAAYEVDADLLEPLQSFLDSTGDYDLIKLAPGRWRFVHARTEEAVDTTEEQQELFFRKASGLKGGWDDESKLYAKTFAAAISTVWEEPEAQRVQTAYSVARLHGFIVGGVKSVVTDAPGTVVGRAFEAAYLSYAGNNPKKAGEALTKAMRETTAPVYSTGWFIDVLRELTFGPGLAIYPGRYDKIRPVLEKLYGVDLPDFSNELKAWRNAGGSSYEVVEVQKALLALGYDLGPAGADGKAGAKTQEALRMVARLHGADPTGNTDERTMTALRAALFSKGVHGSVLLSS